MHSKVKVYRPDKTTGELKYIESIDPSDRDMYEAIKVTYRSYPHKHKRKKKGGE